ncbi:MAG: hypothetical protein DDG59_12260 [Anaerolineae bacterium]|nr:MAG: hypothetical protein DDG59_12260 [Anaerolineae bacterium]
MGKRQGRENPRLLNPQAPSRVELALSLSKCSAAYRNPLGWVSVRADVLLDPPTPRRVELALSLSKCSERQRAYRNPLGWVSMRRGEHPPTTTGEQCPLPTYRDAPIQRTPFSPPDDFLMTNILLDK